MAKLLKTNTKAKKRVSRGPTPMAHARRVMMIHSAAERDSEVEKLRKHAESDSNNSEWAQDVLKYLEKLQEEREMLVERALSSMDVDSAQQEVLQMRYGVIGLEPKEIADRSSISMRQVNQILKAQGKYVEELLINHLAP
ncbi:MAG: hypothetical protein AAF529_08350 [Pseudomonadota bacterium]